MSVTRWLLLIICSAAVTAAICIGIITFAFPYHDSDGYPLQVLVEAYAILFGILVFCFVLLATPTTILLRRAGLATPRNVISAGAISGASLGLLGFVIDTHGPAPGTLDPWWTFLGWGTLIGALSATAWVLLELRLRRA